MKKVLILIVAIFLIPSSAGAVMQSLNGLTGQNQTIVNDTNVRITSAGTTHTLGWNGVLSPSRGGTGANSLVDLITLGLHTVGNYIESITGSSQISVSGSGSESAGVSLGIVPGSLGASHLDIVDGNTATDEDCLTYESGGSNGSLEWQPCAVATTPGGVDMQVQFNDSGTFGGDSAFSWDKTNKSLTLVADNSDNSPLQILAGADDSDYSGIKLWDNNLLRQRVRKVLSAGEGVPYKENFSVYASGYISAVPQGAQAFDATILQPNTVGFGATRASGAGESSLLMGLFTAGQYANDSHLYGFRANMYNATGGGLIVHGTGSSRTDEYGKHITIWGNTTGNTNKAISIGNGTNFTERMYISNDGTINTTGNVSVGNTIRVGSNSIPGCMIMGDSDGSGVTYVTANDGVLSVSSTAPSNCQ